MRFPLTPRYAASFLLQAPPERDPACHVALWINVEENFRRLELPSGCQTRLLRELSQVIEPFPVLRDGARASLAFLSTAAFEP
jgi:hypothetical protein